MRVKSDLHNIAWSTLFALCIVGLGAFVSLNARARTLLGPKNRALQNSLANVSKVRIGSLNFGADAPVVVLRGEQAKKFVAALQLREFVGGSQMCLDPGANDIEFYEGRKMVQAFTYSRNSNELRSDSGLWELDAKLTPQSKSQVDALLKRYGL